MQLFALLALFIFDLVYTIPENPELTYEHLFKFGINAYSSGDWHDCIAFMRQALDDRRYYIDELIWCRQNCDEQLPMVFDKLNDHYLNMIYVMTQRALCILRCNIKRFGIQRPTTPIDVDIDEEFAHRRPYHYLQFCYWKVG